MDVNLVRPGMKVRINAELEDTRGMWIASRNLEVRKPNVEGTILSYVPGHGGDVWFVEQGNGEIGAYYFMEFEQI